MMPKLPKERILCTVMPDDYRYGHVCGYSSADVLAYGRAVAEACAALCHELAKSRPTTGAGRLIAEECAVAIREAAKELGATSSPAR